MDEEKIIKIKSIFKYLIFLIPIVILVVLFVLRFNNSTYEKVEELIEEKALEYVKENKLSIQNETYIEISKLGEIDGVESCSKASGVIVTNNNSKLETQAYVECLDYRTKAISNKEKYIILNGGSIIILNYGEVYNELGYALKKDANIKISGNVGTNPGIYTLKYNAYVNNKIVETAIRKIIITKNDKTATISGLTSTTHPEIILDGDSEIVLSRGEEYEEPGYRAIDYEDGKISRQVKISGNINTSVPGETILLYSVTNSRGNTAIATRKVSVIEHKSNLDIKLTALNSEGLVAYNIIAIDVTGEGFNSVILPNGSKSYDSYKEYKAENNGIYVFKVFDKYGNSFSKEIKIDNIDDIPPTGECSANVFAQSNKTKISVNATDNKGVAGYNYILDNESTGFLSASSYEVAKKLEKVDVNLKDVVGNEATISCDVKIIDDRCYKTIKIPGYYAHRKNGHENSFMSYVKTTGEKSDACKITVSDVSGVVVGGVSSKGAYFTPKEFGKGSIKVTYEDCMCDGSTVTGTTEFLIHEWGLYSMSVSGGRLSPSFYNMTTSYTLYIPSSSATITITASPADSQGRIVSGTGTRTVSVGETISVVSATRLPGDTTTTTISIKQG